MMFKLHRHFVLLQILGVAFLCQAAAAQTDVGATLRELIENQQRILVLKETARPEQRPEARRAGQYLFFRNQHLGQQLLAAMTQSPQGIPTRYQEMVGVIDDPAYGDEDRLVLRGVLEVLSHKLPPDERLDVLRRLERVAALRKKLGGDYATAFQHVPLKPGSPAPAAWSDYVARLAAKTTVEQILAQLDRELIAELPGEPSEASARARVLEWNGEELPEQTVLLTFDDGPHFVHTPAVLDILKREGVHAIFFQVGRNLGEIKGGTAVAGHNLEVVSRIVADGHAVGNHSFTHPVLPKLDSKAVAAEIADTQALLDAMVPVGNARSGSFRPPYGARDDRVLAEIDLHHLRSVVWNIDSEDWADPVPESIAHRVVRETEKAGRGIILMHDIHARTVEALPLVIQELKKRGFKFVHWDGRALVLDSGAEPR